MSRNEAMFLAMAVYSGFVDYSTTLDTYGYIEIKIKDKELMTSILQGTSDDEIIRLLDDVTWMYRSNKNIHQFIFK